MDDPRVGRYEDDNVVWPEQDVRGQPYAFPVGATLAIGDNQFVVVPTGMNQDELLAVVESLKLPPPKVSKRGHDGPEDAG